MALMRRPSIEPVPPVADECAAGAMDIHILMVKDIARIALTGTLPRCRIYASLRSRFDELWQWRVQRAVDLVITARDADFLE